MPNFSNYLIVSTTSQANGALTNGTRIKKCNSVPGDGHVDGALATVVGSLPKLLPTDQIFYFVEWDDTPGRPVGIVESRVRESQ